MKLVTKQSCLLACTLTTLSAFGQPELSVGVKENDQVQLSWPQSGETYNLEKATPLASPSVWVDVETEVISSGGVNMLVTDIAGLNQFYRLRLDIPDSTIALGEGTGEILLGLSAPPNPENKDLTITLTQLPTNGTIKKKDGTIVTVDTILTIAELMELTFTLAEVTEGLGDSDLIYIIDYGGGVVVSVTVSIKFVETASGAVMWSYVPQEDGPVFFILDGQSIERMGNLPDEPFVNAGNAFAPFSFVDGKYLFISIGSIWAFDGLDYTLVETGVSSGGTFVGDRYYYVSFQSDTGNELAWTDLKGNRGFIEIREGNGGSFPQNFQEIDGAFFFTADDGSGRSWWKIEGDGHVPAVLPENEGLPIDTEKDIFYYVVSWNNGGGDFGNDLWGFDGTRAMQIAHTNPGGNDAVAGNLMPFKGGVIFTAFDGTERRTYYFKAGMSGAMKLEGPLPQFQDPLPILDDVFYYSQQFPASKLWSFDGVVSKEVPDQPFPEANFIYPVGLVDRYLVIGHGFGDNWLFDGSTFLQPTLPPELGGGSLAQALIQAQEAGGDFYFSVNELGGRKNFVWDGGTEFTVLTDSYGNNAGSSILLLLKDLTGQIIFWNNLGNTNPETNVYGYDGINAAPLDGENVSSLFNLNSSTIFQGKLLFVGNDPIDSAARVLSFDGVDVQRASAEDAGPDLHGSLDPGFTEYKDKLYFAGTLSSSVGTWSFDGTHYTRAGFTGFQFTVFGDLLCYTARTSGSGIQSELWSWNGIDEPKVWDIMQSSNAGSNPSLLTTVGDRLYFTANDSPTGSSFNRQLWVFDGINPPVKVVVNPNETARPEDFLDLNGVLYFAAVSPTDGKQLFSYDDNAAEGNKLKQVSSKAGFNPENLFLHDEILYFMGRDDAVTGNDWELWFYDGVNPPEFLFDPDPDKSDDFVNPNVS
jgi:hypothetical protein